MEIEHQTQKCGTLTIRSSSETRIAAKSCDKKDSEVKNQQFIVVMALLSFGIGIMNTPESIAQDREQLAAIAKETNRFTTDIYRELSAHNQGNLFVSPYSISTALAMAYAGANGETKAEMAKVLHFSPDDPQLHAKINALKNLITANEQRSG